MMKRWVVVAAVILLIAVGVAGYSSMSSGVPVQAAKVATGSIREFVDERGKTRLPETYLVTMPFGGRIEAIHYLEGQEVKQGEELARISPKDLDDAIAEAQAAVDRLAASIAENKDVSVETTTKTQAELFVKSMISTVEAAAERKKAGESRLNYAETYLGRVRQLLRTGAQTQDDVDRADVAYVEGQVAYRQDVLVHESLKAIQAATDLLPRMVSEFIARKSLTRAVLEKQKQEAEARLRQALTRRERGVMYSPADGIVLERVVSNEQYLAAGTVLLRIGQLERLEVEAEVLSEDVVDVREGDPVEIYGPAIGARVGDGVAGVVQRIYPSGFTKISSLGVEQQRVMVIVRFADGKLDSLRRERELGVDYRVRVRIFTDEQTGAMIVPRSALFRAADGGWQVFAIRNRRAELQPVEVGLLNDEMAEVIQGLQSDDRVVLAPESSLQHGNRVEAVMRLEAVDRRL